MKALNRKHLIYLLLFTIVLLSVDIGFFVDRYAYKYVDSDETIMWNAAADMAQGEYHTPKFYGQAYNTHIESMLATFWMKLGMPVDKAVKTATLLLVYLPFVLLAFLFGRNRNWFAAIVILGVPILLPFDWQIMVGGGRGFMPGIAFASVGMYGLIFHPKKYASIANCGILVGLGMVMNQNAVFVVLPLGVYYLVKHGIDFKSVGLGLMGLIPAGLWWLNARTFHMENPMYDMHKLWDLEWSWSHFVTSLSHFHELFYGLFPFHYVLGVGIIAVLIGITIYSKRNDNKPVFWSALITLIAIVFISGFNKITDGTASLFFPYARFYLGLIYSIPFLFVILVKYEVKPINFWVISVIISASFILKISTLKSRITVSHRHNSGRVVISRIDDLRIQCDMMEALQHRYHANIIVFHSKADTYNYGCASLNADFISIHPNYERRYWVFEEEMYKIYPNIILLDWFEKLPKQLEKANIKFEKATETGYPAIVLKNNTLPLIDIYQKAALNLRKHEPR
jgi:uncharacterized membrane protein